ncbi:MAG: glycoside hydrolase, partial [Bacteroidota bacterium]
DPINAVKEDPNTRGLLFVGSERFVNVSFDDGANWQSLKLNMPPTSIRDLVIKDDDVVVGTHGRSFWILDNITPLRHLATTKVSRDELYPPQKAMRIRWNMNPDTPLPQEEPGGENPPEGAMIDYFLGNDVKEVTLSILDGKGEVVRTYSSNDQPYPLPELNIPLYWIRPFKSLSVKSGHHRFQWDMHHTPVDKPVSFPMSAIYRNTAPQPTSPWVLPGMYTVRLSVDGVSAGERSMEVTMDPRVKTSTNELKEQYDLSLTCYRNHDALQRLLIREENFTSRLSTLPANSRKNKAFVALVNWKSGAEHPMDKLVQQNSRWERLHSLLQDNDMPITAAVRKSVKELQAVQASVITPSMEQLSRLLNAAELQLNKFKKP